ncbi:MAG: hypothetical protein Q9226_007329 [Calogaya cf. arnoldii]
MMTVTKADIRRYSFILLLVFFFLVYSFGQSSGLSCAQPISTGHSTTGNDSLASGLGPPPFGDVKNSTLGFERVFVINLPERYDKLDAFTLASSLTGFSNEVIEGVKGATIVNKTLPSLEYLHTPEKTRNNVVGCWRAHLNFAQKIVREHIQTAIVFEDDADWDVSFKDQLAEFAMGSRCISDTMTSPRSPYGDDWDLLWLGHCATQQHAQDGRRLVIENDDTVPPMAHRVNLHKVPNLNELGYDNSTRIVFRAQVSACTYSYALSYRGAQKVLRWQNRVQKFEPIDLGIGYQCRDDPDFKCISVLPQLVNSHKLAGRADQDSDIDSYDPAQIRKKGYTHNIVHSTRLNIDNLMQGRPIEDQWDDLPRLTMPRRMGFD